MSEEKENRVDIINSIEFDISPQMSNARNTSASNTPRANNVYSPKSHASNKSYDIAFVSASASYDIEFKSSELISKHTDRIAFMDITFPLVDKLISSMLLLDDSFPLANLFFEQVMICRDILNCWTLDRLSNVAIESITQRQSRCQTLLQRQTRQKCNMGLESTMDGMLDKFVPVKGWLPRQMKCKHNKLYSINSKSDVMKAINLSNCVATKPLHTSRDSEFTMTIKEEGVFKTYHYRAPNDQERQQWLHVFGMYASRNGAEERIKQLSIPEKVGLWSEIYRPYNGIQIQDKSEEFLFTTREIVMADVPIDMRVKRFHVVWPQRVGKAKPRIIQFDLGKPSTISFWKQDRTEAEMTFRHYDFQDFKVTSDQQIIDLSLRKGTQERFQRTFRFPSADILVSFMECLSLFRTLPTTTDFVQRDIINALQRDVNVQRRFQFNTSKTKSEFARMSCVSSNQAHSKHRHSLPNLRSSQAALGVQVLRSADWRATREMVDVGIQVNEESIRSRQRTKTNPNTRMHALFQQIQAISPRGRNIYCQNVAEESIDKAEVERLRILVRTLYTLKGDEEKQLKCLCSTGSADDREDVGAISCPLVFYKCFAHLGGFHHLDVYLSGSAAPVLMKEYNDSVTLPALVSVLQKLAIYVVIYRPEVYASAQRCNTKFLEGSLSSASSKVSHAQAIASSLSITLGKNKDISLEVCNLLFSLMVSPPDPETEFENSDIELLSEAKLRESGVLVQVLSKKVIRQELLSVICTCLSRFGQDAQILAFRNLMFLLHDQENFGYIVNLAKTKHGSEEDVSDEYIKRESWQYRFFRIYMSRGKRGEATNQEKTAMVFKLSMALVVDLHFYCLKSDVPPEKEKDRKQHNIMWKAMTVLHELCGWSVDTSVLFRVMLLTLLTKITKKKLCFQDTRSPIWKNFFSLLEVIEEFVFFSAEFDDRIEGKQPRLHLGGDGVCLDVPIINKVHEILEMLKNSFSESSSSEKWIKKKGSDASAFWHHIQTYIGEMSGGRDSTIQEVMSWQSAINKRLSERHKSFGDSHVVSFTGRRQKRVHKMKSFDSISIENFDSPKSIKREMKREMSGLSGLRRSGSPDFEGMPSIQIARQVSKTDQLRKALSFTTPSTPSERRKKTSGLNPTMVTLANAFTNSHLNSAISNLSLTNSYSFNKITSIKEE